jgi:glycosyltransferase involved in cell wall biosynthesis
MTAPDATPRKTLTALIVARNEEAMLPDCLASLDFADRLIVVLDRTSDGSRAVAEAAGAQVIEGAWESEGARRNTGIDACQTDWVLEVDADERATPEVAEEVTRTIRDSAEGYYLIPFRNVIGGREVRYGWGAYNGASAGPRLFSRGAKRWGAERVHPSLKLGAKRGRLSHGLLHLVDDDIADMMRRMDRYTDANAHDVLEKNAIPSFWGALRRIPSRGLKSYLLRQGFREGRTGLALAYFAAFYIWETRRKALALRRGQT